VSLSVRRLELDRDAGKLFWTPSFRGGHTGVEALICDECLRSKINVTLAVAATVEKAKPAI
jgi:hypothetical protein